MDEFEKYVKWRKEKNLPPMTRTKAEFSEWLLQEENIKKLQQTGDLPTAFGEVWKYLRGL